jgi:PAS domain S-box-containing protein
LSRITLAFGVALLALEVTLAVVLVETSNHESELGRAYVLAVIAGVAFMVSGLIALWRRPDNRTGVYLAAVGYLWFFGGLTEANNAWLYIAGFVLGGVALIPFSALLLSHPTGRFETRFDRIFPWIVGGAIVGFSLAIALLDPNVDPECPRCPENPLAVTDTPRVVDALWAIDTVAGIVLGLTLVGLLVRRWRRSSPTLRRAQWPVVIAGGAALAALIADGLVSQLVSTDAGSAFAPVFLACFTAVPIAFLLGILRTRLARSSVSELVVALGAGEPLRGALAGALGDPTLDVVYWLHHPRGLGGAGWVDLRGQSTPEPQATDIRSVKLVERDGERVAAIVYDRVLDSEPELLEAVTAAAGLTLQNDRLQAELRAEVEFMNTVTSTTPSLLVTIDTEGRIRTINLAALEAAGYDSELLAQERYYWELFIDPAEHEAMIGRFHTLSPHFPPGEYENTFTNARGEVRTIYWRTAPAKDAAGNVVSIVSGGLDITERRKRELELERERDATTTALEATPSIAIVLDRTGTIRDRDVDNPRVGANRAFRQALGWRDHELVGRSFLDLVAEDDDGRAAAAIAAAASGGASGEVESELRGADGGLRAFAWTAVPVADVTGRTDSLVLVSGIEVTERRRLEVEKERERAFLNAIANNAPSMLGLIDHEGRITDRGANIAFEQTLGWNPEEIGGQILWEDFIDPSERDEVRLLIEAVVAGAEPKEHDNTWITHAGEPLSVAWTCTPLPEIDERRIFLITGVDITERKRFAEDLRASRARLVRAEDQARRGLERNLHDGAQQRLVALSVSLRVIESRLRVDPDGAAALLSASLDELAHALAELRELARGIHPAVLTDRGLRPALESLAARTPIPVELVAADERFSPETEAAAYYVVSETLTNVARYAQASTARVEVAKSNGVLRVHVSDDGIGGADPNRGSGIRGLVDRVAVLDGTLSLESPSGGGTSVTAEIPLGDESPELHSTP